MGWRVEVIDNHATTEWGKNIIVDDLNLLIFFCCVNEKLIGKMLNAKWLCLFSFLWKISLPQIRVLRENYYLKRLQEEKRTVWETSIHFSPEYIFFLFRSLTKFFVFSSFFHLLVSSVCHNFLRVKSNI